LFDFGSDLIDLSGGHHIPRNTVWVNATLAMSASRQTGSMSASFQKIAHILGRLGSGPRLVGRIESGVRVSASFPKMPASWVG